jgi:hypothetical protein
MLDKKLSHDNVHRSLFLRGSHGLGNGKVSHDTKGRPSRWKE